jgi:hypothetical protein
MRIELGDQAVDHPALARFVFGLAIGGGADPLHRIGQMLMSA